MNSYLASLGPALANHLWQSTAFGLLAWLLTLALLRNQARVRYAVWLAASIKFLIPLSLLVSAGNLLPHSGRPVTPAVYSAMDVAEEPFAVATPEVVVTPAHIPTARERVATILPVCLATVWLLGFGTALFAWCNRWRIVSQSARKAQSTTEGREFEILWRQLGGGDVRSLPLLMSAERTEPGIFGIFRPVLVWPERLSEHLDDHHIEAIVAHELAHVRRRDNLSALMHMFVEAAFWFHPLVWWIEHQMVKEREQACDEAVVEMGGSAETYAESLLRTCWYCVESPLPCVAGVTGADLKRRVAEIVTGRALLRMTWSKKLLLLSVAVCVVMAPVILGQAKAAQRMMLALTDARPGAPGYLKSLRAAAHAMIPEVETPSTGMIAEGPKSESNSAFDPCAEPTGASFDVISIRPSKAHSGDWDGEGSADGVSLSGTMKGLIEEAFSLRDFQVAEGPEWVAADTFDIRAKFDLPDKYGDKGEQSLIAERWKERYRSMLAERFQLRCHMTTKELPVYDLVVVKGGAKWKRATAEEAKGSSIHSDGDAQHSVHTVGTGVSAQGIAAMLARSAGRTVIDKTGLTGSYDFALTWKAESKSVAQELSPAESAPELPLALEEQLGLKLVPAKGTVPVLVIDHAEKPTLDGAAVQGPARFVPLVVVLEQTKGWQGLMLRAINAAIKPHQTVHTMPADQSQASDGIAQAPAIATLTATMPVVASQQSPGSVAADSVAQGSRQQFDAATIKPHPPVGGTPRFGFVGYPGGRITYTGDPKKLIEYAYGLEDYQIAGGPDWIAFDNFDITAVPPDNSPSRKIAIRNAEPTTEQRQELQFLLRDRFGLQCHIETKVSEVYIVTRGTKPLQLKPTELPGTDPRAIVFGMLGGIAQRSNGGGAAGKPAHSGPITLDAASVALQGTNTTTDYLALRLGHFLQLPVLNQTGIEGSYDFDLPAADAQNQDMAVVVLSLVDRLGLKIKRGRGAVQTLVIDHIARPSEN